MAGLSFGQEDVETGRINDVEFRLLPRTSGDSGRDGYFARNFFFVEIRDGVAFVHLKVPICGACGKKHSGGKRRFPAMPVPNESDIPYIGCVKDFHMLLEPPTEKIRQPTRA